jgi:hypothetical protein
MVWLQTILPALRVWAFNIKFGKHPLGNFWTLCHIIFWSWMCCLVLSFFGHECVVLCYMMALVNDLIPGNCDVVMETDACSLHFCLCISIILWICQLNWVVEFSPYLLTIVRFTEALEECWCITWGQHIQNTELYSIFIFFWTEFSSPYRSSMQRDLGVTSLIIIGGCRVNGVEGVLTGYLCHNVCG